MRLTVLLAAGHRNVMWSGTPTSASIGSEAQTYQHPGFRARFPGLHLRSPSTRTSAPPNRILDAANGVIANNVSRKDEVVWSAPATGAGRRYRAEDEYDEAAWVAHE